MPARFAVAAMLTTSFPQRIEMIKRRGWSNKACNASDRGCRSRRSFCKSRRDRENKAVSEPEKNAERTKSSACRQSAKIIAGSDNREVSNAKNAPAASAYGANRCWIQSKRNSPTPKIHQAVIAPIPPPNTQLRAACPSDLALCAIYLYQMFLPFWLIGKSEGTSSPLSAVLFVANDLVSTVFRHNSRSRKVST